MAKAPVQQNHDTRVAWIKGGPATGTFLTLTNDEFERGVRNGWAEDPEGKGAFDLVAGSYIHEDAQRFARGEAELTSAEVKANAEKDKADTARMQNDPEPAVAAPKAPPRAGLASTPAPVTKANATPAESKVDKAPAEPAKAPVADKVAKPDVKATVVPAKTSDGSKYKTRALTPKQK